MQKCPRCDWEAFGAFKHRGTLMALNPGDIIICRNCMAILIVNEDLSNREPTKEEFKKMRSDPETWKRIIKTMANTIKLLKRTLDDEVS